MAERAGAHTSPGLRATRAVGQPTVHPALRAAGLVAGFALAIAATMGVFLTENALYLRLAVIAVAWAFVIAAFAAGRRRTDQAVAEGRESELRQSYELELEREVAARREFELRLENQLRRETQEAMRAELDQLRGDLASLALLRDQLSGMGELRSDLGRLRAELTEQLSGEMLVERIVMRTQSIRVPADRALDGADDRDAVRTVDGVVGGVSTGELPVAGTATGELPAAAPSAPRPPAAEPAPRAAARPVAQPAAQPAPRPVSPPRPPVPTPVATPVPTPVPMPVVGVPVQMTQPVPPLSAAPLQHAQPSHPAPPALSEPVRDWSAPPTPAPFEVPAGASSAALWGAPDAQPESRPEPRPEPGAGSGRRHRRAPEGGVPGEHRVARPAAAPAPAAPPPAADEPSGHERLTQILAESGHSSPGGRRHRRRRAEDGTDGDDVLARVLRDAPPG